MNRPNKTTVFITGALLIATAVVAYQIALWQKGGSNGGGAAADSDEPLYWVAPMDPDYRRDKPGKSPMGMDLVPVYKQSNRLESSGTVTIEPHVINNLGVRTAPVVYGELAVPVSAVGYVQYNEDRLVHIHPRVEGWIERLHVKADGDPVQQGAPLYDLYSPTLVNAQEELILAQTGANASLIDAARRRLAALQVPASEIARIEALGTVSKTITMTSPQSGVLDGLMVREGMFVRPGMEIMAIGQLEHLWVIGEVVSRQAALIKVGDAVSLRLDAAPYRRWEVAVDYIYPTVDAQTRTTTLRVGLENRDRFLKPGMFVHMGIDTAPARNALLIPREALIRTGEGARVVLAMGDGRFKSVAVDVGQVADNQVSVVSGLAEGDRVVTSAQFLIDSESAKTSDFRRMDHSQHSSMNHGDGEMDHSEHSSMNHGDGGMDHSEHSSMNHGDGEMDHSQHSSMNHGDGGMDHSQHSSMNHGDDEMDHSEHSSMNHGDGEMDHSQHSSMNHGDDEMDHSEHHGASKP